MDRDFIDSVATPIGAASATICQDCRRQPPMIGDRRCEDCFALAANNWRWNQRGRKYDTLAPRKRERK